MIKTFSRHKKVYGNLGNIRFIKKKITMLRKIKKADYNFKRERIQRTDDKTQNKSNQTNASKILKYEAVVRGRTVVRRS